MAGGATRMLARVVALFRQRRDDRELEQEMSAHHALLVEEHRRRGLSEDEAERAARLALGAVTQVREAHRAERGLPLLEDCARDLRYAVRGLHRQIGFAAIAVLTLAIGIGASTAVFSVVHGVLIQPLDYRDPDALLSVARARQPGAPGRWISLRRWQGMRNARTLDVGVYRPVAEDVALGGRAPEIVRGARISANVLGILGVTPVAGRGFLPQEDGAGGAAVTIISEQLWIRRFARDPSVVGRAILVGSAPYTVIGVLPGTFQFPLDDIDLWLPQPSVSAAVPPQFYDCCTPLLGIARLRSGATRQQAAAELMARNAEYESNGQRRVDTGPAVLAPLKDDLVGPVDTMLWMLLAAVGFVLLIACANVATLLMARASSRTREFAVRSALGAGRWRLVRQLVIESLVLSMSGGALGLLLAAAGVHAVTTMTLFDLPRAHEIAINGTVLAWTMAIALVTGVSFGTFPSLRLQRSELVGRLRQNGVTEVEPPRRRSLFQVGGRYGLVVAQVALSLILLIGAALMAQTMARLARVDLGFRSAGLLTMRVPLPMATYDTPEKRSRFFDELVRRVDTVPGVGGATIVRALPTTGGLGTNLQIDSRRIEEPGHLGQQLQTVVPGYFEVMGLALKQGRTFTARDNAVGAAPVAIVNESFARRFWPSYPSRTTPVGDRLIVPILSPATLDIVGIVADVRQGGPANDPDPQVYIPDRLYPPQIAYLAVRADGDTLPQIEAIRAQVRAIDANQAVTEVRTMDELFARSLGQRRVAARVLGVFAVTAVVLALVGLYGVMAYSVARRTQEIGVRRALGAGHGEVLRMVLGQGLRLTLIGIACGLAGAYGSTRLLQSLLFGVSRTDAVTFVTIPLAFIAVALLAGAIPAWRAIRIDPARALRA